MTLDIHLLLYVAISALLTLGLMRTVIGAIEQRITIRSATYRVSLVLGLGLILLAGLLHSATNVTGL